VFLVFRDPAVVQIVRFLSQIGISVSEADLPQTTFLPGLCVQDGVLLVDESRLKYPGDLLHEAGHLALLSAEHRNAAGPELGDDGGFEMAAIAWSYAAALHIGIDPAVVFHAGGYREGSQSILENFTSGRYVGVPVLEWLGMTATPQAAKAAGVLPYPKMLRWLQS
jgi:hypothetical protein